MVAVLIASLVIAVGAWLYLRSQNQASPIPVPGGGTPDETATYGGITFVTKPGTASQAAADAGATAYDPNDPTTAQRRLDALARAQKLTDIAASQGKTTDQTYQDHLSQSLADQAKETSVIMSIPNPAAAAAAAGAAAAAASAAANLYYQTGITSTTLANPPPDPSKSNYAYAGAVLNAGPPASAGPQPPGSYWDYTKQAWVPSLF
jgi:hypothetical protein